MRSLPIALSLIFINLCSSFAQAIEWIDSPEVDNVFKTAGMQGTFVLYDAGAKHLIGHDQARAKTDFIPASTFKIPNSLIGLSAVANVDEMLPYGGQPQRIKSWEQDMGLRTLNIDMPRDSDATKRIELGKASLQALGIL